MTTTTHPVDVSTLEPLARSEAIEIGQGEYRRLIEAVQRLGPDQWDRPTDCTEWTVRDLIGHVAGMMWSMSKIRRTIPEQLRSGRRAKAAGTDPTDEMTAIQVERMAGLPTDEIVTTMKGLVDEAVAGRGRIPDAVARKIKAPVEVDGVTEKWSLSYLMGIILTRDTWLHRVSDLARAIGQAPELDVRDGRIVADVVVEWAQRHGRPFELTLTGPAGGRFRASTGGPSIELDALDFCRMLSGRAEPTHELLRTQVPF